MKLRMATLCLVACVSANCGGTGQGGSSSAGNDKPGASLPGTAGTTAAGLPGSSGTQATPTTGSSAAGGSAARSGPTAPGTTSDIGCSGETEQLLWKRGAALSGDLQQGLALPADQLCRELGQADCKEVHRVPLGMDDPFGTGLYEAVARPLATTALATDRIVLRACSARVDKDKAGESALFKGVNLAASTLSDTEVMQVVQTLYQRLLARNPSQDEIDVLRGLTKDQDGAAVSATDFAKLACFAIGTTTEFVLY